MKLKNLGSNVRELNYIGPFGTEESVLFSYETPVAGFDAFGPFRTSDTSQQQGSRTTKKHIKQYFQSKGWSMDTIRFVPQYYIDSIV